MHGLRLSTKLIQHDKLKKTNSLYNQLQQQEPSLNTKILGYL